MRPSHPARADRALARQQGFTAIEMVVTLGVLVVVMLGVLGMFELAGRVSRVQVSVADLQGSLRTGQYSMIRLVRMAGRGNLPTGEPQPLAGPTPKWSLPNGVAVSVVNNVPANYYVDAPLNRRMALAGTDVLTIRGVFNSPVCNVATGTFVVDNTVASPSYGQGSFVVNSTAMPGVPLPQNLKQLADSITAGRPEALVLVSPENNSIYNVVELDPGRSSVDNAANPTTVTVGFRFIGGTNANTYREFAGNVWNDKMLDVAFFGIVEEYRFYIADQRENGVAGDLAAPVKPVLMRAQTYPGTQSVYAANDGNWAIPIADDVADLQVALGIEAGLGAPNELVDNTSATDEWLFNHPADDPALADPTHPWRRGRLHYVRINMTAFASRRDRDYRSPPTITNEDHTVAVPALGAASGNVTPDRSYRRRSLRTVVDLRNIT